MLAFSQPFLGFRIDSPRSSNNAGARQIVGEIRARRGVERRLLLRQRVLTGIHDLALRGLGRRLVQALERTDGLVFRSLELPVAPRLLYGGFLASRRVAQRLRLSGAEAHDRPFIHHVSHRLSCGRNLEQQRENAGGHRLLHASSAKRGPPFP